MKRFKNMLFLLCLLPVLANAKDLQPVLTLESIKPIQVQELDSDELYFDISVYRPKKPTQFLRVPEKPLHIPSKVTEKLQSSPLWSGNIAPDETVVLIISLVESDDSPLNPDDVIGSIKVTLTNQKGKLFAHWILPNLPGTFNPKANDLKIHTFDLRGDHAQYNIGLLVR